MEKRKLAMIFILILLAALIVITGLVLKYSELETRHRRLITDYTELNTRMKKEYDIDVCINRAFEDYQTSWKDFCKINKIKIKNGECNIPVIVANEFDSQHQREKEMCIARYK